MKLCTVGEAGDLDQLAGHHVVHSFGDVDRVVGDSFEVVDGEEEPTVGNDVIGVATHEEEDLGAEFAVEAIGFVFESSDLLDAV